MNALPLFRPVRVNTLSSGQGQSTVPSPLRREGQGGGACDDIPPAPTTTIRNLLITPTAKPLPRPPIDSIDLSLACNTHELPLMNGLQQPGAKPVPIHFHPPRIHPIAGPTKLQLSVKVSGWKFAAPARPTDLLPTSPPPSLEDHLRQLLTPLPEKATRQKPPAQLVLLKERLLTLLQPPLENLFVGKQIELPFKPFPYQLEGMAFLMPRHGALLADEMGLGKTMQAILSLRLLLHQGELRRVLIVCPKPLVHNWQNEMKLWAPDVPVEVITGDAIARKVAWLASRSPVKIVNYELLTRDVELLQDPLARFDLVILDEAQRIKNDGNKTNEAACAIQRLRSWALTGTPIENRPADLISIWNFIHPGDLPAQTPVKELAHLTKDGILRRVKEEVMQDLPGKLIQDVYLELSPAQREAYQLAEEEGIVHLNDLGDTITVQHVFELVMRLKQICNFDPRTGESVKLDQLQADLAEVADSGRKAIVFSQWVQPLEILACHLSEFGPLLYHGKVPHAERQRVLHAFKHDRKKHLILMSYGTGSVGLNLQFANYVFLFDRWWNPAVEDQAINRAHRIGQKNTVFVKRFIAENTIEGRICEVLEHKRRLFEEILSQNAPPQNLGLTESEIFGLFKLKPPPRKSTPPLESVVA